MSVLLYLGRNDDQGRNFIPEIAFAIDKPIIEWRIVNRGTIHNTPFLFDPSIFSINEGAKPVWFRYAANCCSYSTGTTPNY